jgi:hypothetical protein
VQSQHELFGRVFRDAQSGAGALLERDDGDRPGDERRCEKQRSPA